MRNFQWQTVSLPEGTIGFKNHQIPHILTAKTQATTDAAIV
jgi:hypothetical protein